MRIACCALLLMAWMSVAFADAATQPTSKPVDLPAKEKFHLYLLMGQSNMVGRDTTGLDAQVENARILALDGDGHWTIAREPMHLRGTGIGPGVPFAAEMLKRDPEVTIGLVPCAVGGTSLNRWMKGAELYENAIARARAASEQGTLKGVLWHQGESDSSKKENAESYATRLTQMFKDLRQDLNQPDLPIVVGQLGEFLSPEKYAFAQTVRDAIKKMPERLPRVGFADSTQLTDKGDKLHFSAAAERELGARFAAAMLTLQKPRAQSEPEPATMVNVWPNGKMPGRGAKEPEADLPARGDNTRRVTNISTPTLSVFPAPKGDKPAPAIIVSPGGGYSYVVVNKEGSEVAAWLNQNGITAIVLKYRAPHNRDGAFQDIQRALSVTRAHAKDWNIDPKQLGVMGFSAGGNLSAKASTRFDERSYQAIDDIDQQSCRPDFAVLVYPAYLGKDGKVSSDLNLKANIPQTLIIHSDDDRSFIEGSRLYSAALEAVKASFEFKCYATGGHGYGLRCKREARAWPEYAIEWLRRIGVQ